MLRTHIYICFYFNPRAFTIYLWFLISFCLQSAEGGRRPRRSRSCVMFNTWGRSRVIPYKESQGFFLALFPGLPCFLFFGCVQYITRKRKRAKNGVALPLPCIILSTNWRTKTREAWVFQELECLQVSIVLAYRIGLLLELINIKFESFSHSVDVQEILMCALKNAHKRFQFQTGPYKVSGWQDEWFQLKSFLSKSTGALAITKTTWQVIKIESTS